LGGDPDVWLREHRFAPPRRWRFDLAIPLRMVAVEIDGGTWTGGRHVRGDGYERDCRKLNAATALGWAVYRMTTAMAADPDEVQAIMAASDYRRRN
jgi:hypothetical protein